MDSLYPMRRFRQKLTDSECSAILESNTSGVLSLTDGSGVPYGVPMSYCWDGGRLYFHCAKEGRKLDIIRANPLVSFCVTDMDTVVPEKFTTYFRSVIVSGRAVIASTENEASRRAALRLFCGKYSPDIPGKEKEISNSLPRVTIIEVIPEEISGKQAIELVRGNENN